MRWRLREETEILEIRLEGRERESKIAMSVVCREVRVECSAPIGWTVGEVRVAK